MCRIKPGSTVRHVSGTWPCGCDDTDGTVTKLDAGDFSEDGPMAFVGTGCGWQWFPVSELRTAQTLAFESFVEPAERAWEELNRGSTSASPTPSDKSKDVP